MIPFLFSLKGTLWSFKRTKKARKEMSAASDQSLNLQTVSFFLVDLLASRASWLLVPGAGEANSTPE
jgi:hypothetical protein